MARSPAQAENIGTSDTVTGDTDQPKKRRVNRGARGPQPVYLFVRNDPNTNKLAVTKSFRDPRKMAAHMQQAGADEQFLVTTPE
jgi:hypothetical protein